MLEWHISLTCITAMIVRPFQSALVLAIFIRVGIISDLVRDHVRAALVTAILVKALLVRATLVRATLVRATLVRANLHSHIIYSLIQNMKNSLDPRFNDKGFKEQVGLTESPSKHKWAGIDFLHPGLSDYVRVNFTELGVLEPGMSETMSGTMSKLHLPGQYLSR